MTFLGLSGAHLCHGLLGHGQLSRRYCRVLRNQHLEYKSFWCPPNLRRRGRFGIRSRSLGVHQICIGWTDLASGHLSVTNGSGIKSHSKPAQKRQILRQGTFQSLMTLGSSPTPNLPGGGRFGAVSYVSMLEEFACPLSNT